MVGLPLTTLIFGLCVLVGALLYFLNYRIGRRRSEELQRKVKKSLEEQSALLVSIVNSSDDAIVSKKLDGTITSWNSGAQRLFGYSAHEVIGTNITIVIPADRLEEESRIIEKIKNSESIKHYETQRLKKDGSIVHISLTVSPIFDSQGTIIGASKIARDISERMEAAEKLKASEQRFKALIENSYDAIVMNDLEANILYQSPSVTRILGYTFTERVGTQVIDYIHPNDHERFKELYRELTVRKNEPLSFEYRFRHKSGNFIWLEGVVTNLMDNPAVRAIVANYRDITVRKLAEESLKVTLSRFEQAQEIAHLGHWDFDFESMKTNWSSEMFRIFGLKPNVVEASEPLFLSFVHPEDIEQLKNLIANSRKTYTPFSTYHKIVQENGSEKCLLSVGRYEFNKGSKPVRFYGISLDVTELREKEKKLEEVNKDLETFIYRSSHDLKSPIASMLGLLNIAKMEIQDRKALDYLMMVNEIVMKQDKTLRKLIEIMSIREKKLDVEPTEIEKVVDGVLVDLKAMKHFDQVKFTFQHEVHGPAWVDQKLLSLTLYYLLENSIQYSRETEAETIVRAVFDKKRKLVIDVKDNGHGIPKPNLDKVFDMFYRGTTLSKGSGLGLYIVKTAVDRMEGTITAESEEHVGTRFRITIPQLKLA